MANKQLAVLRNARAAVGRCETTGVEVTLSYDTFGSPSDPPLLLLMTIGCPGLLWGIRFCSELAKAGPFYVIRYDHRDCGLSTQFEEVEAAPAAGAGAPSTTVDEDDYAFLFPCGSNAPRSAAATSTTRASTGTRLTPVELEPMDVTPFRAPQSDPPAPSVASNSPRYMRTALALLQPTKRRFLQPVYSMEDLARDAVGLLTHLHVMDRGFHLVGLAMGGAVAQVISITHPTKVRSLTLIAANSGDAATTCWPSLREALTLTPLIPKSISSRYTNRLRLCKSDEDRAKVMQEMHDEKVEVYATCFAKFLERISGDTIRHPFNRPLALRLSRAMFERSVYINGTLRHLAAVMHAPGRDAAMRRAFHSNVAADATATHGGAQPAYIPTLVVHGTKDILSPTANGQHLSQVIVGSSYLEVEGMGHLIPSVLRSKFVQLITQHAHRTPSASSKRVSKL